MNILEKQLELSKKGVKYALLSVAETSGNSPYEIGKKMILLEDGTSFGTVGGGTTELLIKQDALERMGSGKGYVKEYIHNPADEAEEEGLGCSFSAKIFVEVFTPAPHLVVCGGGHVGSAALELGKFLHFDTTLIDVREEKDIGARFRYADHYVHCDDYETGVLAAELPDDAYFVLGASTHTQDKAALKAVMQRKYSYVGMLGSMLKTKEIFPQLIAEGIPKERLDDVHTPIGLDISNSTPEEIALAIMAEILMIKNNKTLRHRGEQKVEF